MNLNLILTTINFLGIVGWVGVLFLVFFLSPYNNTFYNITLFIASFLLAVWGSFATLEYALLNKIFTLSSPKNHIITATRHGFLVAVVLSMTLLLQYLRVLTWWDAGLLVVIAVCSELYFRSR